jgi:hypothetical protein
MRPLRPNILRRVVAVAIMALVVCVVASPSSADDDADGVEMLKQMLAKAAKAYAGINSYDSEVWLQERVGGKLLAEERVREAFVKSPLKIYLRWLPGGAYTGLQASHTAERDGPNNFRALATGVKSWAGVQKLALDSALVKKLYPHKFLLNQYHMGFMISHIERVVQQALSRGKLKALSDKPLPNAIPGRQLRAIEVELGENAADGISFRRAVVGFDQATMLPLLIQTFNADGGIHSSYRFIKFSPNVALDDGTFDIKK